MALCSSIFVHSFKKQALMRYNLVKLWYWLWCALYKQCLPFDFQHSLQPWMNIRVHNVNGHGVP